MKAVTSTDANRDFSRLLRAAAQGETVQITSRGRPVATLGPVEPRVLQQRLAAKVSLLERLATQPIEGLRDWSRDDLYD